jgi:hypothetical protein
MRTNAAENRAFAHVIANKLNKSTAPVTILLPEKGVSALDSPGKPFYDPEATGSLFDELEKRVIRTKTRKVGFSLERPWIRVWGPGEAPAPFVYCCKALPALAVYFEGLLIGLMRFVYCQNPLLLGSSAPVSLPIFKRCHGQPVCTWHL